MRLFLQLVAGLFCALPHLSSQTTESHLPNQSTRSEWLAAPIMPLAVGSLSNFTDPPVQPVRTMGEWEELQALLITWNGQSNILTQIVRESRKECRVIVACHNNSIKNSAINTLVNAQVDTANVAFVVAPNNSIWVRDYGPNCVYANDVDSLFFVDWRYNRISRPLDDQLPEKIGTFLNVPVFSTSVAPSDLVHTGGNFMSDGMETAFSSKLVLEENDANNPYGASPKDEVQIDQIFEEFMGIKRYIKFDVLPFDAIHHIDMHMKLLDEQTLLVGQYPDNTADGPQIEANIQYLLANQVSAFGTPYQIIRIPMPPDGLGFYPDNGGDYRTYANAVFVNKTVLVPFYQQKFDTTAQRIWQESLPGYNIVGINCNSIIGSNGAIHCITKEIGTPAPLRIVHKPLPNLVVQPAVNPADYWVEGLIQHRSGISQAKVWYKTDDVPVWQSIDLAPSPDSAGLWVGAIPYQPSGQNLYYYFEATALNGKVQKRPIVAPEGWWKVKLESQVDAFEPDLADFQPIFPNPARAITCLPIQANQSQLAEIRVVNTLGQVVETVFQGELPSGPSKYFIDARKYAPGTYFVEFESTGKRQVQKLLITR